MNPLYKHVFQHSVSCSVDNKLNTCHWPIGIMVRVFANGPEDWGPIPGRDIPKTQKMVLMPSSLTLSIKRYGSRVSGAIQGKEYCSSFHLSVITIEKRVFRSLLTAVD